MSTTPVYLRGGDERGWTDCRRLGMRAFNGKCWCWVPSIVYISMGNPEIPSRRFSTNVAHGPSHDRNQDGLDSKSSIYYFFGRSEFWMIGLEFYLL